MIITECGHGIEQECGVCEDHPEVHLTARPLNLCIHGIDRNSGVCWACESPEWARTCPKCNQPKGEPLSLDGFLCGICHIVYVVHGNTKYFNKAEIGL